MKEFLKILYKILDVAKVAVSAISLVYAFFWFAYIFGFKFVDYLTGILAPIADFTRTIVVHEIKFEDKAFDSTYMIVAIVFAGIFFLITKLNIFISGRIETEVFKENIRKAHRDAKTNLKVARVFKEHISKTNYFLIYLDVRLKYAINEALIDNKSDLKELKAANYAQIIKTMSVMPNIKTLVHNDRLEVVCANYSNFEKVFTQFLESLNIINAENMKKETLTEIYFVIDGCENDTIVDKKRGYLKRILSFGYKDKAITTTLFAKRYEQEPEQNYVLCTMGKIRFFEDSANKGKPAGGFLDFELFTLKRRRSKDV